MTVLDVAEQDVRTLPFCLISMMAAPEGPVKLNNEVANAPVKVTVPKLANGASESCGE